MDMKDENYKFFTDFWSWITDTKLENNAQDVPYDLMCAICHDLLFKPFELDPCHHIFCEPCVRRLSKARIRECPMCRQKIKECHSEDLLYATIKQKYYLHHESRNTQGTDIGAFYLPYSRENNTALYEIFQNQKSPYTRGFRIFMKV